MYHTADAPHVWGLVVLIFNNYDFGRSIPSGAHMYRTRPFHIRSFITFILQNGRHFSLVKIVFGGLFPRLLVVFDLFLDDRPQDLGVKILFVKILPRYRPGQSEITNFDLAILWQKHICRFDISMHNICFVQECHCAEAMIQNFQEVVLSKGDTVFD